MPSDASAHCSSPPNRDILHKSHIPREYDDELDQFFDMLLDELPPALPYTQASYSTELGYGAIRATGSHQMEPTWSFHPSSFQDLVIGDMPSPIGSPFLLLPGLSAPSMQALIRTANVEDASESSQSRHTPDVLVAMSNFRHASPSTSASDSGSVIYLGRSARSAFSI